MLNRRTLRVKIMQSLFAFDQCKEANYELALQSIRDHFQPDLNSMEVQDKELLRQKREQGVARFEQKFAGTAAEAAEPDVEQAVDRAITGYHQQVAKDKKFLAGQLKSELQQLHVLYLTVLRLLPRLADMAAADKRGTHTQFVTSEIIQALRQQEELKREWLLHPATELPADHVRTWFRELVKEDPEYQKFIDRKAPTRVQQQELLKHLIRKVILGPTIISDFFDERDIRWAENRDIIKSLVEKTIKSYEDGKLVLQKVSLDLEDDQQFIEKLFDRATELPQELKELIAANTRNWEVDRLPLTDRVILEMALAEMVYFPSIPVKVTINEFIELTKDYSTPKSRQFINGILDVLSKKLSEQGKIKKSGRGLIDNK